MKKGQLLFILLGVIMLLGLQSCGIFKKSKKEDTEAFNNMNSLLEESQIDYKWFAVKSSIQVSSEMGSIKANCQYRIEKDKAIWISANKFGIEAVRALITPDSIFAISRLTREYYAEDIDKLSSQYGVPSNFDVLQEILVGNPWLPEDVDPTLALETDSITVHAKFDGYEISHGSYTPISQLDYSIVQDTSGHHARVIYKDYQLTGNDQNIPFFRSYLIRDEKGEMGSAEFSFKEVSIDVPQKLPFDIPKGYKKGSL